MGLTQAQLDDQTEIIACLRNRCNAGRNKHNWRQRFSLTKQAADQSADDWLCELRDLARKCEFATDCCARCEPTRILGQVVAGVFNDEVRVKFLEQGAALTLDQALTILRTAESSAQQSTTLKHGDAAAMQATSSTYKSNKQITHANMYTKPSGRPFSQDKDSRIERRGCWNCGATTRCNPIEFCPAQKKECNNCNRLNHYAKVCKQPKHGEPQQQSIFINEEQPSIGAITNFGSLVSLEITPHRSRSCSTKHPAKTVLTLPDTGADLDAIPESLYTLKFPDIPLQQGIQPCTAIGSPIISLGVFQATIDWIASNQA